MSFSSQWPLTLARYGRPAAAAITLGAACLANPLGVAAQPVKTAYHHPGMAGAELRGETVDQRISNLHEALKITPDEEQNWGRVAQVMRANDAAMRKLMAERTAAGPHGLNALDDLKTYERFSRAHVEGLKDLIASFEVLYNSMSTSQRAVADHVFQHFGHDHSRSNG